MRKCCKKQTHKKSEVLETVDLVDKLVLHKMKNINITLPALVTVVTPILAYLFTSNTNANAMLFTACAAIYGLIILGILLWTYLPVVNRPITKTNRKYFEAAFSPSNLTQSAYLSDADFLKQYEKHFCRALTPKEKNAVSLLKNKINEMRFRTNCLCTVFTMLILGVMAMIVLLLLVMMGVAV